MVWRSGRRQQLQRPDRPIRRRQPPPSSSRISRCAQRLDRAAIEQVGGVFQHARRCRPARRPRRAAPSAQPTGRTSPVAAATVSNRASSPGSAAAGAAASLWNASITWNSGCRDSERAGLSTSTSRSNGTSACAIGRKVAGPHPARQAPRKRGLPEVSVRSTRVLTKNPTRSSSAASRAPRDRAADRDVGAGAEPGQQRRKPGLQHHEQARPAVRAPAPAARRAARHRAPAARCRRGGSQPRGRGRSAGSSICSGRPARRSVQYPSCRPIALAASRLLAQHRLLPQRVVGVLHRQRRQRRRPPRRRARVTMRNVPPQRTRATSRRPRCGAARSAARARPAADDNSCGDLQLLRRLRRPHISYSCARSGSSAARSKPRSAAAVSAPASAASLTATTASSSRAAPAGRISCRGTPSRSGNSVRRLSCRVHHVVQRAISAARSSPPVSRTASGIT